MRDLGARRLRRGPRRRERRRKLPLGAAAWDPPTQVAWGQVAPGPVAVDATHIYRANEGPRARAMGPSSRSRSSRRRRSRVEPAPAADPRKPRGGTLHSCPWCSERGGSYVRSMPELRTLAAFILGPHLLGCFVLELLPGGRPGREAVVPGAVQCFGRDRVAFAGPGVAPDASSIRWLGHRRLVRAGRAGARAPARAVEAPGRRPHPPHRRTASCGAPGHDVPAASHRRQRAGPPRPRPRSTSPGRGVRPCPGLLAATPRRRGVAHRSGSRMGLRAA